MVQKVENFDTQACREKVQVIAVVIYRVVKHTEIV